MYQYISGYRNALVLNIAFGMNLGQVLPVDIISLLKLFIMTSMTTLSSVLEKLRIRKQDNEFKISDDGFCAPSEKIYQPEDLLIIKTYRFEGDSDPADNSILYLIEANDGLVGYSLDAYGVYSNHADDGYDEFISKIVVNERDDQEIFI